jgi:hypothetical protein
MDTCGGGNEREGVLVAHGARDEPLLFIIK